MKNISKPYTIPIVVSLPSKSVHELFQTFFDILEDYALTFDFDLAHMDFHISVLCEKIYINLQRKSRDKKKGKSKHGFLVQKVLDFRQLQTAQALTAFMYKHGGMEGFVVLDANDDVRCINVEKGKWHSLECLESGSVLLESKDGAYVPLTEEEVMG